MKKIKVLEVGLDTNLGGIETYLLTLASGIDKNLYSLDFLSFDNNEPCFASELTKMGCGIKYVRSRRTSWFGNAKDIRKLIKTGQYNIVHCHLNSLTYITPALEGLKAGCKVIVQSHNGGMAIGSSSRLLNIINRIRLPYNRLTLVAVSDIAGKWMFGKHSYQIISNGVNTDVFKFDPDRRKTTRNSLSIPDNSSVVIHVGAFRTQKNHSFIIDVFNEFHKKHENSFLILVGDGELKQNIEERAKTLGLDKSIIFTGNRKDIPNLLSAADSFLFPSLYEGAPLAMIEAEANGLNCVVSDNISENNCFENCTRLSLASPKSDWISALEKKTGQDRKSFSDSVKNAGYGIDREIRAIEQLYKE